MYVEGNDVRGGMIRTTYRPEAVDEALAQLNSALKLVPQDISVHKGRLHVLEVAGRYDEMAEALDESCSAYKETRGADEWIRYTFELYEAKHYRASIKLLEVLDKHYPNSYEVLGNFDAMHSLLKEDDQAIAYLHRAVAFAPDDPIDTWDLGREYDYAGKIELADQWYQKALTLDTDATHRRSSECIYAEFVEKKLHDLKRACELQRKSCEAKAQTACAGGN